MAERNVSREQAIALHLARVMEKEVVQRMNDGRIVIRGGTFWSPHHDRAQWAECVEWAAVNGYGPTLEDRYCLAFDPDIRKYAVKNDGTGEGIRAAALEAIARATGWPGMEGE